MRQTLSLAAAVLLSACSQNPATGNTDFTLVGEGTVHQVGSVSALDDLKTYGLYRPASAATAFVKEVCARVYDQTEVAREPVACNLLNNDEFNASATPGYIMVNSGLLPYVGSEAELAAVLGHESGHLAARHIAQAMTVGIIAQTAASAASLAALAAGGVGAYQTADGVGQTAVKASAMTFSRREETQADELGRRYMARAGYDPREQVAMFDHSQAYETYLDAFFSAATLKPVKEQGWFSSHPGTPARRAAAAQASGEPDGGVNLPEGVAPATPRTDPQGRDRYLAAVQGMQIGPARGWGVSGRGYLTLPLAHVRFALPENTALFHVHYGYNPEDGVWKGAYPAQKIEILALNALAPPGVNPANLLYQKFPIWSRDTIRRLPIQNGEASTGYITHPLGAGIERYVMIQVAGSKRMAALRFDYPDRAAFDREDADILKTLASSRALTQEETDRLQTLRLDVRMAQPHETVEVLAAALPAGMFREEWFRALNGLAPSGELKPGQKYKTVVDPNL